jgi:hypothetical protein
MENQEKVETPVKPERKPEPSYNIGQVRVLAETEKGIGIAKDPPSFDDQGREEVTWFPKKFVHITSDVVSKEECEGDFIVDEWIARREGYVK